MVDTRGTIVVIHGGPMARQDRPLAGTTRHAQRSAAVAAVATGVMLLGAVAAPAAHADGVDETELAQLRSDIAATSAAWTSHGGTEATRCTISFGGSSASSVSRVEFAGGKGAVHLRYGSSSVVTSAARAGSLTSASAHVLASATAATHALAAGGGRAQAYLTPTAAVVPLPGRVRTALERHGLRTTRSWSAQPYRTMKDPSFSRATYRSATSLDGSLLDVVAVGRVTALTSTTEGATTTYRGTATDPSVHGEVDPLDFVVVVTGGDVARVRVTVPSTDDDFGVSCRTRLSLGGTTVRVPHALERHPEVVSAEGSMLSLSRLIAMSANMVPRNQHARVRMVQALAWSLAGSKKAKKASRVAVTERADGVVLTRQVRGWEHPLRWQVTVRNGHVHAYPVVTAPQGRHR